MFRLSVGRMMRQLDPASPSAFERKCAWMRFLTSCNYGEGNAKIRGTRGMRTVEEEGGGGTRERGQGKNLNIQIESRWRQPSCSSRMATETDIKSTRRHASLSLSPGPAGKEQLSALLHMRVSPRLPSSQTICSPKSRRTGELFSTLHSFPYR